MKEQSSSAKTPPDAVRLGEVLGEKIFLCDRQSRMPIATVVTRATVAEYHSAASDQEILSAL
jgi:hypothetical protein